MLAGKVTIEVRSYSGELLRTYKDIDAKTISSCSYEVSFCDSNNLLHRFLNATVLIDEQPEND